jgi:Protein of unknown function (DUF3631)
MGRDPGKGPQPDHGQQHDDSTEDLDVGPSFAGMGLDERSRAIIEWAKEIDAANGGRPKVVSGAECLDAVEAFLSRFVVYPSEAALVAHVLWIAHAHALDKWESTPRIAFLSPEPGSGKTRALEVTELLVPRPVSTVNVTSAYLFRRVADPEGPPTVLFDEIDTVFGPRAKSENEDIRGLLNAGHRKGATAGRCVVKGKRIETEELPAYAAVALAGLDDLPDTLMSRSVVIRMRRRAPDEPVQPFRRREWVTEAEDLREELADWMDCIPDGVWPDLPTGITDRNADVWEALIAVADFAGGSWPERARVSAVTLVTAPMRGTHSLGIRLLTDLRTVFGEPEHLLTVSILEQLNAMEDSPWGDIRGKALDARGLSRRLAKFGVERHTVRLGSVTGKGYSRGDLSDTWKRYLEPIVTDLDANPMRRGKGEEEETSSVQPVLSLPRIEPVTSVTRSQGDQGGVGLPPGWLEQEDARRRETRAVGMRRKAESIHSLRRSD